MARAERSDTKTAPPGGAETTILGVIGLGYVGLPLAVEMARSGFRVIGFDISARLVEGVSRGESHIQDVTSQGLRAFVRDGRLSATSDLSRLSECDAISICVPTPLSKTKDPDLSYVASATRAGVALYERIFETLVPVSSAEAAELVKLHENTFRMINIALPADPFATSAPLLPLPPAAR
jgi:UDP-N-acetyl-D-mannosaminuronate dehydrogenase